MFYPPDDIGTVTASINIKATTGNFQHLFSVEKSHIIGMITVNLKDKSCCKQAFSIAATSSFVQDNCYTITGYYYLEIH